MPDSAATRFLGGPPFTVLVRLAVVSVVVGVLMSWLGIDALDVLDEIRGGFARLYGTGFAALRGIAQTTLAGAAVVVPAWLVLRCLGWRGSRPRVAPDAGLRAQTPPRWSNPERARE